MRSSGPSQDAPGETVSLDPTTEVGTSVELFAGGGGLAMAMHAAGFRHLLVNELARRPCETLRSNKAKDWQEGDPLPASLSDPWPLIADDVRNIGFHALEGKVDVVAGGPPCQPFSLGGIHRGHEDERNMFPEFFRVIRETRPKAVICENVFGLLRPSFRPYFDYIIKELSAPFEQRIDDEPWYEHDRRLKKVLVHDGDDPSERYDVDWIPVNAADYGVPQIRRRVIIVAFRRDLAIRWRRPSPTHSEAALLRAQQSGEYWKEHNIPPVPELVPKALPQTLEEDDKQRWRTLRDAICDLPKPIEGKEIPGYPLHIGWPGARIYRGHTPSKLDRPAKTVKAGVHGVAGGECVLMDNEGNYRYMTVREVARVMTFPDKWVLAGPRSEQMRQLGNAVPVRLGYHFARAVAKALRPELRIAIP